MHEYTEGIMNDGAAILKDGVQMSVSEVIAELNRANALEEALRPIAKMWIDTKAVFIGEGEELPIGISIDVVSLPQWVDISSEQLDAIVTALERTR